MAITLSIRTASAELKDCALFKAITFVAAALAQAQLSPLWRAAPTLEVAFLLPGRLDKPSFAGMRMGGYRSDEATLYFERAVPEGFLHTAQGVEYVHLVLQDAVDHAAGFFAQHGLRFDDRGHRDLLARLARTV